MGETNTIPGQHKEGDTVRHEGGTTHGAHDFDHIRSMIERGSINHVAYISDYVATGELTREQATQLQQAFRSQYGGDILDTSKIKG